MFRLGKQVARLGTAVATRSSNSEPGAATRQRDSNTREAPRGGEGDDSLLRVARAGADSPLRDAPRHYSIYLSIYLSIARVPTSSAVPS
eukprot:scaffold1259_cov52-Phaeocystis_antarctica.AAC.1